MTDEDDYARLEDSCDDWLNESGEYWETMTNTQKEQVIIDKWFQGLDSYSNSARLLREGLEARNKTKLEPQHEIKHMKRRGHEYIVVKDKKTNRFVKFIRLDD